MRAWPALLVVAACNGPSAAPGASASAPVATASTTRPGLSSEEDALVRQLCNTATCAGPMARLAIWRDAKGALARVVYDGDLQRCSHPPRGYFDAAGKETLTIPEKPVTPGSPEAVGFQEKQNAELAGLIQSQTLFCGR